MESLKALFVEGITYEQFEKAVAEKGIKLADLSQGEYVAKGKLEAETAKVKKLNEQISTLSEDMKALQESNAGIEDYKAKFEELQKAQAERDEAEKAKQLDSDYAERFNAITADKKFVNEHTKNGVMSEWRKAIESGEHKGKGDADIFTALTKDTEGLYAGTKVEVLRGGNPMQVGNTNPEKPVVQKQWNKFSDL